jgi:hypothetical protein
VTGSTLFSPATAALTLSRRIHTFADRSMKIRLLSAFFLLYSLAAAEEAKEAKGDKEKSYGEIVKNCDISDGLFLLYTDRDTGTVYLAVKNEQIGKEFIHFSYVLDGVASLGLFRGQFLDERIFEVQRHFDRIEFVARNTAFYFDPDNALSRAANANISDAVLASQKIIATTEDKTTSLIKADDLFLKELFSMIKPASDDEEKDKKKFVLGDLSAERTRFTEVRNYPENSLLRVNYVFENKSPKEWGEDDVTNARYITIAVQHALIAVPENGYQPRFEDPRVGYFTTRVTDLTSKDSANYRDLIHRWNLKKKNPEAEKSDPVEPITWWIENTTPVEFRDIVKNAVEGWNTAFESAGFTNAVVCKMQPDDADWDAGDIRYNVLRWTSSPDPPFGGYGPSFVNPRTGEILGADIMLEYVFVTNRVRLRELIQKSGVSPVRNENQFPFSRRQRNNGAAFCQAGNYMQENAISSRASLAVAGASQIEMDALLEEALYDLVLHEVGHTLGLNHNFIASHLLSPEHLNDKKITAEKGVIASVMDYTPANISRDRTKQGDYYSRVPGPYDHWAIRFGYTATTEENDATTLAAILSESSRPENAFGNDGDDMRTPGRGIDPRIMINDLSSDPIAHAIDTIERIRETMAGLVDKFPAEGDTYHELRTAFATLMKDYDRSAATLTRFVGGVQIDRSTKGQAGAAEAPFLPVPVAEQQRALEALHKYVFGPESFTFFPPKLIASLQLQRRGFENFDLDGNEDPKIHATVAGIQKAALDHLLHEHTLQRIVDTGLYGNKYDLATMMTDLNGAVMEGNRDTFREALQIDYIERLIKISGLKGSTPYIPQARSEAVFLLEKSLIAAPAGSAHEAHLKRLIANALEGK